MIRKLMMTLLCFLVVGSNGIVSAEKSVWKNGWFYGALGSGALCAVGVGGAVYSGLKWRSIIRKLKENSVYVEDEDAFKTLLSLEEYEELLDSLKIYKILTGVFTGAGLVGLLGAGVCGYKTYATMKAGESGPGKKRLVKPGEEELKPGDLYKIAKVKGELGRAFKMGRHDPLNRRERHAKEIFAYVAWAKDNGIEVVDYDHMVELMKTVLPEDKQERAVLLFRYRIGYDAGKISREVRKKWRKQRRGDVSLRFTKSYLTRNSRERRRIDHMLEVGNQFLEEYNQDPVSVIQELEWGHRGRRVLSSTWEDMGRRIKIMHDARELALDENFIRGDAGSLPG